MGKQNALICSKTGQEYSINDLRWKSEADALLNIRFVPAFDKHAIRMRSANMWRYREALPISFDTNIVSFGEGATPLQTIELGTQKLLLKLDFMFPTGSYKDRGASVLVSKMKELGIKHAIMDSSGNAGAAIAAYCAKAGILLDVYAPESTSSAKLTQIMAYGANLKLIKGTRQDATFATLEALEKSNSYYASHAYNPFFFQGTKTFAYEICEQLGWKTPDTIILPAGNGTLIIGAYIGFRELLKAGITTKIPKIIGVQVAACAPLYQAFTQELLYIPDIEVGKSYAEGLMVAAPVRGMQIIQYVELTGGYFLAIDEQEIKKKTLFLAKKGYFVEPTSAAVFAGALEYLKIATDDEIVVSVLTGSGLKAGNSIREMMKI